MKTSTPPVSDEFVRAVAGAAFAVLYPMAVEQVEEFVRQVYEGTKQPPKYKRKQKRVRP